MLFENQSQSPVLPPCPHKGLLNWSGWRNKKGKEDYNVIQKTLKLALEKLASHLPHYKLDWITSFKVPALTFCDSNFPL